MIGAAVPSRRARPLLGPASILVGGAAFLIMLYCVGHDASLQLLRATDPSSAHAGGDERLRGYDFPPSLPAEPPHLTPMDPSALVPRGTQSIDAAHREGILHVGSVLYVMDASGALLFLQRSADVVTCPSTWSILGEHSQAGESQRETVVRGMEEELGFVALNFDESDDFGHVWTAELRPSDSVESLTVTIENATEFPLYYIRHYGPRNGNRIDRQLTYLWWVRFPRRHEEISWRLDDEVADHRWMGLDEVRSWLADDAAKGAQGLESGGVGEGGVRDDGPDERDFCHGTIRAIYEAGLRGLT